VPQPILQIVVASTRPGRVGRPVADWFETQAKQHAAFQVEVIDLAEVNLPFFDEPRHPRLGDYAHDHTKAWSKTVIRGDAYVFVTPEYNYGFNAVLNNALDYLSSEWAFKPALIVSYGGVSAGTLAAQMLKQVLAALRMIVAGDVNIPFVSQLQKADGSIDANGILNQSAQTMLDELLRVAERTTSLRTN
jgi:NAD(P)H-dependent FMN reductase